MEIVCIVVLTTSFICKPNDNLGLVIRPVILDGTYGVPSIVMFYLD